MERTYPYSRFGSAQSWNTAAIAASILIGGALFVSLRFPANLLGIPAAIGSGLLFWRMLEGRRAFYEFGKVVHRGESLELYESSSKPVAIINCADITGYRMCESFEESLEVYWFEIRTNQKSHRVILRRDDDFVDALHAYLLRNQASTSQTA